MFLTVVTVLLHAVARSHAAPQPPEYPAFLSPCSPQIAGQQWRLRSDWGDPNTLIVNGLNNSQFCLDVWDWRSSNNSVTQAYHCCCDDPSVCPVPCGQPAKNFNQRWGYDTDLRVTSGCGENMCLTVASHNAVVIYSCGAANLDKQQWVLGSTGELRLAADLSLCLTAAIPNPAPAPCPPSSTYGFCNISLPPAARAADLVDRLTLAEKITQLSTYSFTKNHSGFVPGVARLGLPPYNYHTEGLHGVRGSCDTPSTLFPQVTGMAATGNMSLVFEMASIMGQQFRAAANVLAKTGNGPLNFGCGLSVYGPTLNIIRDPRWGRSQESISEDPFLNGIYAANFIRGVQGDYNSVGYLQVSATCKHLVAYSQETDRETTSTANVSSLDLFETYLPAFEACVKAGAQQVMCSYNRLFITDQPNSTSPPDAGACYHGDIQNGIVRDVYQFNGSIVSDCDAILDHASLYASPEGAVKAGIEAGCDMDCGQFYSAYGLQAVQQGLLAESAFDAALTRILTMRFKLGEFDPPDLVPYNKIPGGTSDNAFSRDSALRAAQEAIVLLQNDVSVLPLTFTQGMTVAVIGPAQNNAGIMFGAKTDYHPAFVKTVAQGLLDRGVKILNASACQDIACASSTGFASAVALARRADVVIAAVGIDKSIEAEALDRTTIGLPGQQTQLIQQLLAAVGPRKLVVVLVNGGSVSVDWVKANVPTVVEAFEGGQSAGTALAAVLFGDINPSGILPYTVFPSNYIEQIRMDNYEMRPNASSGSPGRTYRFFTGAPLWPFGWGLSYSNFTVAWAAGTPAIMCADKAVVSVNVTNFGPLPGAKVVLAFVTGGAPAGLLRTLLGIQKIFLQVNESRVLTFDTAAHKELGYCPLCGRDAAGRLLYQGVTGQRREIVIGNGRDKDLSIELPD